jgi:ammonia channel protein AmtB
VLVVPRVLALMIALPLLVFVGDVAGLVGAYMLGPRIGFGRERLSPHNLPLTYVGASLWWVGWFGFNRISLRMMLLKWR